MGFSIATFDSEAFCGYTQISTFFQDFSIADNFGVKAINDTYKRAFKEWKTDYKMLTELCLVTNWKCWQHEDNAEYCRLYSDLYYKCRDYALKHLKGDELSYFYWTTD